MSEWRRGGNRLTFTVLLAVVVGLVAVVGMAVAGIAIGVALVLADRRKREEHGD